ncbi:MAG: NAD(P)H-dependent oxidoreductase [Chloroflexi bacterium]|nr:NAD(P)H-dependent oxidoreductase [Chloroflexota bacterium]
MHQILIIYTTQRGRTESLVDPLRVALEEEGVACTVRRVEEVTWEEMKAAHGILIGNPARFGGVDWQIKRLFDVTAFEGYPGPLAGKVGGVFTAGSRAGSGGELAMMAMIWVLLNHGMIVQGNAFGAHYGPLLLRGVSQEEMTQTTRGWAKLWADLVRRLFPDAGAAVPAPE